MSAVAAWKWFLPEAPSLWPFFCGKENMTKEKMVTATQKCFNMWDAISIFSESPCFC
jgi:hypothetical protein